MQLEAWIVAFKIPYISYDSNSEIYLYVKEFIL